MSQSTPSILHVEPRPHGFAAQVTGLDLSRPMSPDLREAVLAAWAKHGVLSFPNQPLTLNALEAFTLQIGAFGDDPYIEPMPGHPNVLELRREADEKATNFGAGWHSDWSFMVRPPAATILRSEVIPPVGGDTLFADATRAYDDLSEAMKAMIAPLRALHSASRSYGTEGVFARDTEARTMKIKVSEEANKTWSHPLVRTHPVTGRKALFINPVYTVGIEGFSDDESKAILGHLFAEMLKEKYIYRHTWSPGTLLMWDNRCTMHFAQGGYDGHLRLMHRTTVAGEVPA